MAQETNPFVDYLRSKGLSENTIYFYMRYYERLKPFPFTQDGINSFFSKRKMHNSVSRGCVKNLIEFTNMEGKLKLPPKKTGGKGKRITKVITQAQIKSIRKLAYEKNKTTGFLFDFIYYGALRRSEVGKMKVNSFDWDKWFNDPTQPCELRIEMAKGNKDRIVLMPSTLVKSFLDWYLDVLKIKITNVEDLVEFLERNNKHLFVQKTGIPLRGWTIWKIVNGLAKKLGIEVTPHQLRHSRATELEEKGLDIRAIQHYLGHSNLMVTEVYLHSAEKKSIGRIKEFMKSE